MIKWVRKTKLSKKNKIKCLNKAFKLDSKTYKTFSSLKLWHNQKLQALKTLQKNYKIAKKMIIQDFHLMEQMNCKISVNQNQKIMY